MVWLYNTLLTLETGFITSDQDISLHRIYPLYHKTAAKFNTAHTYGETQTSENIYSPKVK